MIRKNAANFGFYKVRLLNIIRLDPIEYHVTLNFKYLLSMSTNFKNFKRKKNGSIDHKHVLNYNFIDQRLLLIDYKFIFTIFVKCFQKVHDKPYDPT